MKKLLLLCCSAFVPLFLSAQSAADKIEPELWARMTAAPADLQSAIVYLADQEDSHAMLVDFEEKQTPLETRNYETLTRLMNKAAATQPVILDRLRDISGVDQNSVQTLWIVNAIFVKANAVALERLALMPEVGVIAWDGPVTQEKPVSRQAAAPSSPNGSEVGLYAIKANFMWNLGYTGYGRKVLVIDTGQDGAHPALADKFWWHQVPKSQAWTGSGYPEDCDEHGTHVCGTTCGLDRKTNDTIGVAFNAHWMGGPLDGFDNCAFEQTIMSILNTLQWALNPDGNVQTLTDRPDAINCSFNTGEIACNTANTKAALNALEAGGVAVVWSGGNTGPAAGTVVSGASLNTDLVNSFSVGAVNGAIGSFPIADFSSRGPTPCGGSGSLAIKPEVCAPGVGVRSCTPDNTYQSFEGTSMAAPHTSGAILLLKEAFPTLSGTQIKLALYNSATDLGVAGEDNAYGKGMINLQSAYNYLVNAGNTPAVPVAATNDVILINVTVSGICKGPVVPTVTFENAGVNTLTSLHFEYGIEGGQVFTHDWTGTLAPNTFTNVTLPGATGIQPGTYDFVVHVGNPNGVTDARDLNNRFKRRFEMNNADYPEAAISQPQTSPVCKGSRVLLEYTGALTPQNRVQWFANAITANVLAEGETFLTPVVNSNTTYYVNTVDFYNVGKVSPPDNTTSSSTDGGLVFTATKAFLLRSVKIYAPSTGNRVVKLLDSQGNVLAMKIVQVMTVGEQRITLNFNVPEGTGMFLTFAGSSPLVHTSNAPGYPHTIPGVVSIYSGKTATGSNTPFFYYYFFDWEIEVPLPCGRLGIPIEVSATSAPAVVISAPDTISLALGGQANFSDNTAGSTSRTWDFGNGQTSTDLIASTTYTQVGNYTVNLQVNSGGCITYGNAQVVVVATSGIKNPTASHPESVTLFPNPANEEINFGFSDNNVPKNLDIRLVDLLGRSTGFYSTDATPDALLRYDVSHLPEGIYLVEIRHEGELYWSGKFVKQ